MALLICPECANKVSKSAGACPNCGFAIRRWFGFSQGGCPACGSLKVRAPLTTGQIFGQSFKQGLMAGVLGAFSGGRAGLIAEMPDTSTASACLTCGTHWIESEVREARAVAKQHVVVDAAVDARPQPEREWLLDELSEYRAVPGVVVPDLAELHHYSDAELGRLADDLRPTLLRFELHCIGEVTGADIPDDRALARMGWRDLEALARATRSPEFAARRLEDARDTPRGRRAPALHPWVREYARFLRAAADYPSLDVLLVDRRLKEVVAQQLHVRRSQVFHHTRFAEDLMATSADMREIELALVEEFALCVDINLHDRSTVADALTLVCALDPL